jgi:hypothetical protein
MLKSVRGVAFTADAVSLTPSNNQIDDDKSSCSNNVTPVPRDAASIDRYYLYGWTVTGKWLQDVAIRYKSPRIFRGLRTPSDGLLFLHSIYKDIHLVNALVEPGNSYPEADTYLNCDGDKMTMMVCIFTNVKDCSIEGRRRENC